MKRPRQHTLDLLRSVSVVGGVVPGWFPLVVDRIFPHIPPPAARVSAEFEDWRVDFDLNDYVQRKTYFRSFERREMRFLRRWLEAGDCAVDVGANVGILTLVMARAVGAEGRVLSIEPNPEAYQVLSRWVGENHIAVVQTINAAAGDEPGLVTLGVPELKDSAYSTGHYSSSHSANPIEVRQTVLDDEISAVLDNRPIRVLKLDVEGMERQVLLGLRRHLSEHRIAALLFEVNPRFPDQDELGHDLERHGYSLHALAAGGRVGRRIEASDLGKPRVVTGSRLARNVIALAPG